MQEILEGVVTGIDGDYAKVRPKRHSTCDDCQACNTADMMILAYNPKKVPVGETVEYVQAQHGMLLVAWVLFLQPMFAVFVGIGLGSWLAPSLGWPPVVAMATAALLLLAAAVAFILWFDRRFKLKQSHFAKITAVIP